MKSIKLLFLVLTLTLLFAISVNAQPLPEESFEGTFAPANWSLQKVDANAVHWQQTSSEAHTGTYCAYHNDDDITGTGEAWIVTPAIVLDDPTASYVLKFWADDYYYSYIDYHGVWISTTDETMADSVELYSQGEELLDWTLIELDISAFAGDTVWIGFKYTGDWAARWFIDDVSVVQLLNNDLIANNLTYLPSDIVAGEDTVNFEVDIFNSGIDTQSVFDVYLEVYDEAKALVFDDTLYFTGAIGDTLFPDSIFTLAFDEWIPTTNGDYEVYAYVVFAGDEDTSNDTTSTMLTVL